ncbi:MAG TPA: C4-type zinc ribbon domain-containing protein [Spirochaetia bacterium]|nr:C4-type zinc ribbon domain-containing protein [Spirochaetia bacterium]
MAITMEEVYEKLKNLQDVLSEKFSVEAEIRDIPKALATKQELVNRLKKSYIEKSNQYSEVKERIKSLKFRMEEAETSREKYEQQMDLIKTQREYEALDKEIRDASDREQSLRKELQREEKVMEEMSKALERDESMIKDQENELSLEQDRIKTESELRGEKLKELEVQEKDITPGLDEEMVFKFERIIRSKAGVGIVPLRKGVCTGCHMILPMQFVNDVRQGDDVLFCPYCSRILFFQEEADSTYTEVDSEGLADLFVDDDEEENDEVDLDDDEDVVEVEDDDEADDEDDEEDEPLAESDEE